MSEPRDDADATVEQTVEVVREDVSVTTRPVVAQVVRIRTRTHEEDREIDVPLRVEDIEIERLPVDHVADAPPEDRQEGDTLIISVWRETPVVQTKYHVFEEIHVRKKQQTERHRDVIKVRRLEATVEKDEDPTKG